MKVSGIITEFNPFHNGHKFIVDCAKKESDCVIAVISGNYVQRGYPALFNKFIRTTAAINNGVDIVIELPSPWSASFAENFAFGGISILKEMKVSNLFFGCECNDLNKLTKIALAGNISIDKNYKGTYAKARQIAIKNMLGNEYSDILNSPNNNLAIEYIKAANKFNFSPNFHAIKRIGASHDSCQTEGEFASASYIRDKIISNENYTNFVPENTLALYLDAIKKETFISDDKFSNAIISTLRKNRSLNNLPDLSEGIENRLKKALVSSIDYNNLTDSIKTKRYTMARVRRLILAAFLELDTTWINEEVPYLNILGFSKVGEQYLKSISSSISKPYVFSMKPSKTLDKKSELLLNKESERNDIYMSLLHKALPCKSDYTYGLIKRKD